MAIPTPPEPEQPKLSSGGGPITFQLVCAYATPTQHDRQSVRPSQKEAACAAARAHTNPKQGKTAPSHPLCRRAAYHAPSRELLWVQPPRERPRGAIRLLFYSWMLYF